MRDLHISLDNGILTKYQVFTDFRNILKTLTHKSFQGMKHALNQQILNFIPAFFLQLRFSEMRQSLTFCYKVHVPLGFRLPSVFIFKISAVEFEL